jgi:hypothetical protein
MSMIRSFRRRDEDIEDEDEDETANAYASIAAQLQQFTSPKLGSLILQEDKEESYDNNNAWTSWNGWNRNCKTHPRWPPLFFELRSNNEKHEDKD